MDNQNQNSTTGPILGNVLVGVGQATTIPYQSYQRPCPSCGHCPTCGHTSFPQQFTYTLPYQNNAGVQAGGIAPPINHY